MGLMLLPVSLTVLGLNGCAATAVVATVMVVRMLTPHGYKLTIKAEERPRDLYNGLVQALKAAHPDMRIAEENQPERYFEASWRAEAAPGSEATTEWVSFVVQPLPDETSELVIAMGYGTNRRADYRQWALNRIDSLMGDLGVEWKVASVVPGADGARVAVGTTR
jgi:hypothetical protein